MTPPTVAFATLGCRLNQVDTQEIQAGLEARGFCTVGADDAADVVIVNTCTVTARADVSDRQAIARAARQRPGARLVVTGCWAQTSPGVVARLRGVDLVVGNADKPRLPDLVARLLATPSARPGGSPGPPAVHVGEVGAGPLAADAGPARRADRSRAFLKVQEGCQHRCAFCIVPVARGPSRSRPPGAVLEQVQRLIGEGHREVTLTGVDLGHYGADLAPRTSLAALLSRVVEVPGLRWVRLSSLLPAYLTPALLEVLAGSPAIAPHLHVPLQSGSDRVLRRMRRPYDVARYRQLAEALASTIPGLGLGADVMVGFPGEGEAEFGETMAVVGDLPLSYLHVFSYSDRAGTEATRLGDRVDPRTAAQRSRALRALGESKHRAFRAALVGTVQDVLVLGTRDPVTGGQVGLTGNYVEVVFDGPAVPVRGLARVRIRAVEGTRTLGEPA